MASHGDEHAGGENDFAGLDDESVHYSDEEENFMEGRRQTDEPPFREMRTLVSRIETWESKLLDIKSLIRAS
jgi:hypothetical protein